MRRQKKEELKPFFQSRNLKRKRASKVRELTQDELLQESEKTEEINRESLKRFQQVSCGCSGQTNRPQSTLPS